LEVAAEIYQTISNGKTCIDIKLEIGIHRKEHELALLAFSQVNSPHIVGTKETKYPLDKKVYIKRQ
jgi:hypothetical protein